MATFTLELVIEPKPLARDPEGEVIRRDLMNAHGFEAVSAVRSGKLLRITLEAASEQDAERTVLRMANELRLVNPVAHSYSIRVAAAGTNK
jgi:phosphoribosylformylglycinamidine synthase PurS subunit